MAKEGLLRKLLDIGWDDFERKVAQHKQPKDVSCLLYTSDAADD